MTNKHYWLALSRLPNVGPVMAHRWLAYFKDIQALFSASVDDLRACGLKATQIADFQNSNWPRIEKDLQWLEKNNSHVLIPSDPAYPALLRELPGAPLVLYVQGDIKILAKTQLAIVGSRHPSVTGMETAWQFAKELAANGLVITSGLALGIDGASHRGALQKGKTIAVIGTGLDYTYPRSHHALAKEIVEQGGALVSEFPPESPPKAAHFPMRNRIISGLSLGVLVIEAALRSGSLITARTAVEQNREVFAVPGSIHNPLARGCHQLIRQGAKLVETAADILEEIGVHMPQILKPSRQESIDLDPLMQRVLAQIGYEATSLDTIILRSGLTTSEVSSMLLSLELEGYVRNVSGGYMRTGFKIE